MHGAEQLEQRALDGRVDLSSSLILSTGHRREGRLATRRIADAARDRDASRSSAR